MFARRAYVTKGLTSLPPPVPDPDHMARLPDELLQLIVSPLDSGLSQVASVSRSMLHAMVHTKQAARVLRADVTLGAGLLEHEQLLRSIRCSFAAVCLHGLPGRWRRHHPGAHDEADAEAYIFRLPETQLLSLLTPLAWLTQLELHTVPSITTVTNLPHVKSLKLVSCQHLAAITALPALQQLDVTSAPALASISQLPQLQHLCVAYSGAVTLTALPALRKLHIVASRVPVVEDLPALEELSTEQAEGPRIIRNLPALKALHIKPGYEDPDDVLMSDSNPLEEVAHLPALRTLNLACCHRLTRLDNLPQLQDATLEHCTGLDELNDLPRLQTLHLRGCGPLWMVSALPQLQSLTILECPRLTSVAWLPQLQQLVLQDCPVSSLYDLPALEHLDALRCDALNAIVALPQLRYLSVRRNSSVERVGYLPALQELHLLDCPNLDEVGTVSELRVLSLHSCPRLQRVLGAHALQELRVMAMPDDTTLSLCVPPARHLFMSGCKDVKLLYNHPCGGGMTVSAQLPACHAWQGWCSLVMSERRGRLFGYLLACMLCLLLAGAAV